ncbi:hypothetical protein [Maricaulis maris]|nr:hypothetical protein [Maricaulis maris]
MKEELKGKPGHDIMHQYKACSSCDCPEQTGDKLVALCVALTALTGL